MKTGYSIIDTLRDFVVKMENLDLDYMVTGSFAMSAYGSIRFTRDVDVVVEISRDDVAAFVEAFEDEYYVSDEAIMQALTRRSMFNVINHRFGGKIDCIMLKDTNFARLSFSRRRKAVIAGVEFWNSTVEDLIIAKLNWARKSHSELQINDIANLTDGDYDSDYVKNWIAELGLDEIWSEVEAWKTQHRRIED